MPVFLNNVDDYLGPSQACVNPLFTAPAPASSTAESKEPSLEDLGGDRKSATIEPSVKVVPRHRKKQQRRAPRITYEDKSKSAETNSNQSNSVRLDSSIDKHNNNGSNSIDIIDSTYTTKTKKKATVTLSDCLACSGCVTSAEAVLMSHHSIDKLKELCAQQKQQIQSAKQKKIVFTISPASLSDLYRHLYLEGNNSEADDGINAPSRKWLLEKVSVFLHKEFGAEMVIDGTLPQTISLLESATEFCYRYRKEMSRRKDGSIVEPETSRRVLPSIALSSTQTRFINKTQSSTSNMNTDDDDALTEVTTVNHPPGLTIEEDSKENVRSSTAKASALPVLTSSCPGFVCLVEKTASSAVPLLSSAKSPMAVAGTLIKTGMCSSKGVAEADKELFHVAIMPCHDKKLEAGRGDLSWEEQTLMNYGMEFRNGKTINESKTNNVSGDLVKEVDMVLTTGELLEVLTEAVSNHNPTSNATNSTPINSIRCILNEAGDLPAGDLVLLENRIEDIVSEGNANEQRDELYGSGSYADYIFRYAAWDLFHCKLPSDETLPWADSSQAVNPIVNTNNAGGGVIRRRRKRSDMSGLRELSLYKHTDGTYSCTKPTDSASISPALTFATAYGFKNVQTVLQSLSKKTLCERNVDHHYIEIMACPSGCPNGGGQIGTNGRRETPRETKERVKKVVQTIPRVSQQQDGHQQLYYGSNEPFNQKARRLFHTNFHIVPELELSTGASAGVAVNQTKW